MTAYKVIDTPTELFKKSQDVILPAGSIAAFRDHNGDPLLSVDEAKGLVPPDLKRVAAFGFFGSDLMDSSKNHSCIETDTNLKDFLPNRTVNIKKMKVYFANMNSNVNISTELKGGRIAFINRKDIIDPHTFASFSFGNIKSYRTIARYNGLVAVNDNISDVFQHEMFNIVDYESDFGVCKISNDDPNPYWGMDARYIPNINWNSDITSNDLYICGMSAQNINDWWHSIGNNILSPKHFWVEIDSVDNVNGDTFKWSDDGKSTWKATGVTCSTSDITLGNGITIRFGSTTGHASGDHWDWMIYPCIDFGNELGNQATTNLDFHISTVQEINCDFYMYGNTDCYLKMLINESDIIAGMSNMIVDADLYYI